MFLFGPKWLLEKPDTNDYIYLFLSNRLFWLFSILTEPVMKWHILKYYWPPVTGYIDIHSIHLMTGGSLCVFDCDSDTYKCNLYSLSLCITSGNVPVGWGNDTVLLLFFSQIFWLTFSFETLFWYHFSIFLSRRPLFFLPFWYLFKWW